jgi:hypothetical protein
VPSRTVVVTNRRRQTPRSLAFFISRATRLRPAELPVAAGSPWMRGEPWMPREPAWIASIRSSSAASLLARAEGARADHA